MSKYEVEFRSVTWRTLKIEATSAIEAEEKAWGELADDCDISKAWQQNAEVIGVAEDNGDGSWTLTHSDDVT